jgi:hypothetical protein
MEPPRLTQAYYSAPTEVFLRDSPQTILGHLAERHPHELDPGQRMAWLAEIELLKRELTSVTGGWIALESLLFRAWAGVPMPSLYGVV